MLNEQLRIEREKFVSGLHGTTMLESAILAVDALVLVALRSLLADFFRTRFAALSHFSRACLHLLLDFLLVVLPLLLLLTTRAVGAMWIPLHGCYAPAVLFIRQEAVAARAKEEQTGAAVSVFRSVMMLITCIAILAVDFEIFPRRFAKAETFGTGSMDVGVGLFVFANGITAARAHRAPSARRLLRKLLPLVALGAARLLAVKAVQYQEHVGEYGVHWNFFLTLAVVVAAASLLPPTFPASLAAPAAASAVLAAYQAWLLLGGGSSWLMDARRDASSLLSLNKEGLASCAGFSALYLLSLSAGRLLLSPPLPSEDAPPRQRPANATALLLAACAASWSVACVLDGCVERVSRRSCNAAYVWWVLAHGLLMLAVARLLSLRPIPLLAAIDRFMLPTFLLANLCTGAVNMAVAVPPSAVPPAAALLINAAYCALLCAVVAALHLAWPSPALAKAAGARPLPPAPLSWRPLSQVRLGGERRGREPGSSRGQWQAEEAKAS